MSMDEQHDVAERLASKLGEREVFGEPVQQGGTTLLPVARVRGGGGGGGNAEEGLGGGFGLNAEPTGAFSISAGGAVAWHPAVNVNRIVRGGQLALAVVAIGCAIALRRRD
ncbi:hypothetical protein [Saccharopolyspora griseoalba]|uniref:Sporulation protein n=1 Tax=Saccharopolyspora griseoalba TaxID=1431848 RepID=A0ABW2LK84_9PSEU